MSRKKIFTKAVTVIAAAMLVMSTMSSAVFAEDITDAPPAEEVVLDAADVMPEPTEENNEMDIQDNTPSEEEQEENVVYDAPVEEEMPEQQQPSEEIFDDVPESEELESSSEAETVPDVVTAEPTIFDANGGAFSDGTDTDTLTADDWMEVSGTFTNADGFDADTWDLAKTPEGYTLRYIMMDVTYQSGGGEYVTLKDSDGNVLLVTDDTVDHLNIWKAVLTESPMITVTGSETPEGAFGYEVKWTAVYSMNGEGIYEEPANEGYAFAGWYGDPYGESEWDGHAGSTVYAKWLAIDKADTIEQAETDETSVSEDIKAAADDIEVIDNEDDDDDDVIVDDFDDDDDDDDVSDNAANAATQADADNSNTNASDNAGTNAGTGTAAYVVKHMLMDTDGVNYTLKDTEHLTGTPGTQVSPTVKTYEGFTSPNIQTATIAQDGSTEVEYRYARNSFNYTLTQIEGADLNGSTPTGTRYYGEEINLKCTPSAGYEFVQWSNGDTSAVTSFTMPAEDVTIAPTVRVATYTITYDLDGGTASNPDSYTMLSEAFTLNAPTKEGAVFSGWTGANGDTPQVTVTVNKGTSGDLSFKANWNGSANTSNLNPTVTPAPTNDSNALTNVQTGDTMRPYLYAGIGVAAALIILFVIFYGRKKKK